MVKARIPSQDCSQSFIIRFASAHTMCTSMGEILSFRASAWQLCHSITAKFEIITYFHFFCYSYKLIRQIKGNLRGEVEEVYQWEWWARKSQSDAWVGDSSRLEQRELCWGLQWWCASQVRKFALPLTWEENEPVLANWFVCRMKIFLAGV